MPAVVLAAGASSRMGRPKALLRVGDRTFVARVLDVLRAGGAASAVVVVRPGAGDVMAEVAAGAFGHSVENPHADQGQLSSLLTGLDAVESAHIDGIMVTLVDVPLISAGTVRTLFERARHSAAPILRAVHRGRHGHPVIFKRAVFGELRRADPAVGAKAVMRTYGVEDVEVDDPGVAEDVDTPDDYDRLREMTR